MLHRDRSTWVRTLGFGLLILTAGTPASAQEPLTLTFEAAQTAVLDPANWDTSFAGERYFDALRGMLVRFPGSAERIHAQLGQGYAIDSVQLQLRWVRQEGANPQRGRRGQAWGAADAYTQDPGRWHAEVRTLRKPWCTQDDAIAPTFNAYIGGLGFWERGGARADDLDRHPRVFGPEPLHEESPTALLDITPALVETTYGDTVEARLRALESQGLLVHKHELFDMKYTRPIPGATFHDGSYDWRVATGYMRIWVDEPKLIVTFRPAPEATHDELPAPTDVAELAENLRTEGGRGQPSIHVPNNLPELVNRHLEQPNGVPDWQWARLRELDAIGGGDLPTQLSRAIFSLDPEQYREAIRSILATPPRMWRGHRTPDMALIACLYEDLLPPGVLDHIRLYWYAWTHPGLDDIRDLPRLQAANYFRAYCRVCGTMNFNLNSIYGTLLAGQLLDEPHVLRDGRWGLEHNILRLWAFHDGAHQEIGDTYYHGISLAAVGALRNCTREPLDRLMALIATERLVDPLVSAYHPGLRRIVCPQGRGRFESHLLFQEGPYTSLHTLSQQGVLMHTDLGHGGSLHGVRAFGVEGTPGLMARLGPWGEPHKADLVDAKAYPWRVMARDWGRRTLTQSPDWHVNYMSEHYAMASWERTGVNQIVFQWRRRPETVEHMDELSTLLTGGGQDGRFQPGNGYSIFHHDNRVIALQAFNPQGEGGPSLHASLGIISTGDVSQREVWINGRRCDELSGARPDPGGNWMQRLETGGAVVTANDGDAIAIGDGVTYLAVTPIAVNTPERDIEVQISHEYPLLLIHVFARNGASLDNADGQALAGFVLEMSDREQSGSFEAFHRHAQEATPQVDVDRAQKIVDINHTSGGQTMAMRCATAVRDEWAHDLGRVHVHRVLERTVNGRDPYLAEGIHRLSPWSIQGHLATLQLNGAALRMEAGRRGYLQADPDRGVYRGYNPLPDPTLWFLETPEGAEVAADGRVGLLRVRIEPGRNNVHIDHVVKPEHAAREDMARSLLLFGLGGWIRGPRVVLNGAIMANPRRVRIAGRRAWIVPLSETHQTNPEAIAGRYLNARRLWETLQTEAVTSGYLQDWHVIGPFPCDGLGAGLSEAYPPEQDIDLTASYPGIDGIPVEWRRLQPEGTPALGAAAVDLLAPFEADGSFVGYAATEIVSDRERDAYLYVGLQHYSRLYMQRRIEGGILWVNDEPVLEFNAHEQPGRDGMRVPVRLNEGVNTVLLKFAAGAEQGWNLLMRVGDAYGFPLQ